MIIYIDSRESALYKACLHDIEQYNKTTVGEKNSIQIIQKQMPLGDIIICSDDGKEHILIERKTLADMASSILDGRYKEQSMRLNACSIHNHNIVYLIEGVMNNYFSTRLERKSLLSSLITVMYYKGFSVYKTNNIQESSEWIVQLARKLSKDRNMPFFKNMSAISNEVKDDNNDNTIKNDNDEINNCNNSDNSNNDNYTESKSSNDSESKYSSVIKRVKKDNITQDNIGEIMLSQIPGVSVLNAQTIMSQFKTIKNLMHELAEKGESVLSNIKQNNRKISKTCISNIYKYLIL